MLPAAALILLITSSSVFAPVKSTLNVEPFRAATCICRKISIRIPALLRKDERNVSPEINSGSPAISFGKSALADLSMPRSAAALNPLNDFTENVASLLPEFVRINLEFSRRILIGVVPAALFTAVELMISITLSSVVAPVKSTSNAMPLRAVMCKCFRSIRTPSPLRRDERRVPPTMNELPVIVAGVA